MQLIIIGYCNRIENWLSVAPKYIKSAKLWNQMNLDFLLVPIFLLRKMFEFPNSKVLWYTLSFPRHYMIIVLFGSIVHSHILFLKRVKLFFVVPANKSNIHIIKLTLQPTIKLEQYNIIGSPRVVQI